MQASHFAAPLLGAIVVVGLTESSRADGVALNNTGGQQSTVETAASDAVFGQTPTTNSANVDSLPFDTTGTPTRSAIGTSAASLRSLVTSDGFSFTFGETLMEPADPGAASGTADIFFTAVSGEGYAISGNLSVGGTGYLASANASLYDDTTSTYLYNFSNSLFGEGSASFALDTTGGPLTGVLVAGNDYEFVASEGITNESDPSSTGNIGISFAPLPLPRSESAELLLMALVGAYALRRGWNSRKADRLAR